MWRASETKPPGTPSCCGMGARWKEEVDALLRAGIASHTFPAAAVAIGVASHTQVPASSNSGRTVSWALCRRLCFSVCVCLPLCVSVSNNLKLIGAGTAGSWYSHVRTSIDACLCLPVPVLCLALACAVLCLKPVDLWIFLFCCVVNLDTVVLV